MESTTKGIMKILGAVATVLTIGGLVYTTVFDPDGNLLLFCAVLTALLTAAAVAFVLWVRLRKRTQTSILDSSHHVVTHYYADAERRQVTRLGSTITAVSVAAVVLLVLLDCAATPVLARIEMDRDDPEVLVLSGRRFHSGVEVRFDDKVQVPIEKTDERIRVAVPKLFEQGNISVRAGPRSSESHFYRYHGITYDVAVCKLVQPLKESITEPLMDQTRPLPIFPYYSPKSDDWNALPPRARKTGEEFYDKLEAFFGRDDVAKKILRWRKATPDSDSGFHAGGPRTPRKQAMMDFSHFRGWFHMRKKSDREALDEALGQEIAGEFLKLEGMRQKIVASLPTRILILHVANQQTTNAENLRVEIEVAGSFYDAVLNAQDTGMKSLAWSPAQKVVEIDRLPPGYDAEILVWYSYLPASEMMFSRPADEIWEKTEGVRIRNMTINNGYVRPNRELLSKRNLYNRLDVDPVIRRSR